MLLLAVCRPATAINVAVFNFEMKSATPEWKWLEKGLSDRILTDLFQDRSVTIVKRDLMQRIADQMKWVPEMMGNEQRITEISRMLRPEVLISGVFEVERGQIKMSVMLIDMNQHDQIRRREVEVPVDRALEGVGRLSDELLASLTNRPPDAKRDEMPRWTSSIPAARALYEGIDYYDKGEYGEAWLKFRQAERADEGYVECKYWIGRMYHFMNRYRHARRAYEQFVYLDARHPRMGDAIKEYLYTFEALDAPLADLG
ncbi:MAG: hypothetical protein CMJ18_05410 [Phycisphaeraceae bacterium]|nr:hypothetical protein [Phycisphaeraceae bacterium]